MKTFLKSELFLKVLSLFIAILLWVFVVYQENPNHEIWINGIPVNFINKSENFENGKLVITSRDTEKINIKVHGKRSAVSKAKASSVNCTVNLSDIEREGTYTLPVSASISTYGVEIISREPYNITLTVDKVVTEERAVEIVKTGIPKSGFVEGEIVSTPGSLKITGPENIVKNIATASVSIDLTDVSEDVEGLYKIRLYDASGKEIIDETITKNVEYCDVKCPVLATKEVSVSPVLVSKENSLGHKVTVSSVKPDKVILVGKSDQLARVEKIETKPIGTFNISEKTVVEVGLRGDNLPEGVSVKDITDIKVELKSEPDKTENGEKNTETDSKSNP